MVVLHSSPFFLYYFFILGHPVSKTFPPHLAILALRYVIHNKVNMIESSFRSHPFEREVHLGNGLFVHSFSDLLNNFLGHSWGPSIPSESLIWAISELFGGLLSKFGLCQ